MVAKSTRSPPRNIASACAKGCCTPCKLPLHSASATGSLRVQQVIDVKGWSSSTVRPSGQDPADQRRFWLVCVLRRGFNELCRCSRGLRSSEALQHSTRRPARSTPGGALHLRMALSLCRRRTAGTSPRSTSGGDDAGMRISFVQVLHVHHSVSSIPVRAFYEAFLCAGVPLRSALRGAFRVAAALSSGSPTSPSIGSPYAVLCVVPSTKSLPGGCGAFFVPAPRCEALYDKRPIWLR